MVRVLLPSAMMGLGTLVLASLPVGTVPAAEETGPAPPPFQCLEQLAGLSWGELEQLYRQAEAGSIPHGFARGRVVYCPDEPLAGPRSRITRMLWHGKHFCATQGTLVNQWLGFRAIRARIGYGPSWLDGKTAIILDYAGESKVWADARDEMREVAPGLYVGAMYLRRCPQPHLKLFFCLSTQCP